MKALPQVSKVENGLPQGDQRSPFAVSVMRAARDTLLSRYGTIDFSGQHNSGLSHRNLPGIDTTHDYIHYSVGSTEEYEKISRDTSLLLTREPAWDYEFGSEWVEGGTLTSEYPLDLFAVVDHTQERPAGANLLEYIHLPETREAEAFFGVDEVGFNRYIDSMEYTAFALESIDVPYEPEVELGASRWNASGRITVQEAVHSLTAGLPIIVPGTLGVPGVKVLLKRNLRRATTYTNSFGTFRLNDLRRSGKWSVVYKTRDKAKVTGPLGDAHEMRRGGEFTRAPWNKEVQYFAEREDFMNCTIINGVYRYDVVRVQYGLGSPWKCCGDLLNIRADYDSEGPNRRTGFPFTNEIKLAELDRITGDPKATSRLQRTLAHELTHSAHRRNGDHHLTSTSLLVTESYADFIEWLFCERYYPNQSTVWNANGQDRRLRASPGNSNAWNHMEDGYTPIFIDLVDDDNQCVDFSNVPNCDVWPFDNVSGYTPWMIQQAVFDADDIRDFDSALRGTFGNRPQSQAVTNMIEQYYVDLVEIAE